MTGVRAQPVASATGTRSIRSTRAQTIARSATATVHSDSRDRGVDSHIDPSAPRGVEPEVEPHFVCPDCGEPCSCPPDSPARRTTHRGCGAAPSVYMIEHRYGPPDFEGPVIVFHNAALICPLCAGGIAAT